MLHGPPRGGGPSVPIPKGQYRYPRYRYPKPSTDTPYVVFQQADSSEQFEYRYSKGVSIPRAGTDTLRMGTDTLEQRSATVICNAFPPRDIVYKQDNQLSGLRDKPITQQDALPRSEGPPRYLPGQDPFSLSRQRLCHPT
ncbi:hypothetical protein V6N11_017619 [Hibiscus sabdariffa]|uniref:Uncharacterized protein n=1 Tax=Hibiscus sabdariffa TaxID=183260 RepID=A0ABR2TYL9_9ROSI